MKSYSLRFRLVGLAALAISLVLLLTGIGFHYLFQRHVERFVMDELNSHFEQLLNAISVDDKGQVVIDHQLSDPRFQKPNGGLYWQIDVAGQPSLRSRSLWDEALKVPTPPTSSNENHAHELVGPLGHAIFALEKFVVVTGPDNKDKSLVITVGVDRDRVSTAITSFSQQVTMALGFAYLALLGASIAVLMLGLKPLSSVQRAIELLRKGHGNRMAGSFPSEVQPLVEEVNGLVAAREIQLERARQRAGNLAHGLKTPLAVLSTIARDVRRAGQTDAAVGITESAGQMRDLVDRELARSRMSDGSRGYRSDLGMVTRRIVETMKRAPRGDAIQWSVAMPEPSIVSMDSTDLTELLGNLTDNARKYAHGMVRVSHDGQSLIVEDDGPGVAEGKLSKIMQRGVKLDESVPGSGIGLSIVKDLADVYGLEVRTERSTLGGLAMAIHLPLMSAE